MALSDVESLLLLLLRQPLLLELELHDDELPLDMTQHPPPKTGS